MKNLLHEGRSVIVTGSRRGLGVEVARRFVEEGANVVITVTNDNGLEDVRKDISSSGSGEVITAIGDVSSQQGAIDLIETAISAWGKLDILVNNAGGGHIRPFLKLFVERFRARRLLLLFRSSMRLRFRHG